MREKILTGTKSMLLMLAVVCMFFGWTPMNAKAESASVTNLIQVGATNNSVTLAWTGENATSYGIYTEDENGNEVFIASTTETTYTITGLESATKYYFEVKPVAVAEDDYIFGIYLSNAVTLPDQMQNVHQEKWWRFIEECDIAWDEKNALEGYEYQFKNASGKISKKGTIEYCATNIQLPIKNNQIYTFKIRGYMTFGGQKYYTEWKEINCFEQAWVTSISQKTGAMTIKWTNVKGATGYDIYVSTKQKTGYKKVKSVGKNKTSYTVKTFNNNKISGKKTYYVYVLTKKKKETSGVNYVWNSKKKGKDNDYIN